LCAGQNMFGMTKITEGRTARVILSPSYYPTGPSASSR